MAYLVDSDMVIDFLADDPDTITLFDTLSADGIFVSIISYMETFQGVIDTGLAQDDQEKFTQFFASVPVLSLSPAIAIRCAYVRSAIKQQGKSTRRRALDLLIAATALEHGLELVSHNEDDYKDIPNLKRYQW
jgi:tRNA(fMet)-specific endonuclease VapC